MPPITVENQLLPFRLTSVSRLLTWDYRHIKVKRTILITLFSNEYNAANILYADGWQLLTKFCDVYTTVIHLQPGLSNALGPDDGYYMNINLSKTENSTADNRCTVYALQIPYIYAIQQSNSNYARDSYLLIDNRENSNDINVKLCESKFITAYSMWDTFITVFYHIIINLIQNRYVSLDAVFFVAYNSIISMMFLIHLHISVIL